MQNPLQNLQKTFPKIDLGDFILREKNESDTENFFAYYSDPKVNQFILCEIPCNLEEAKKELNYWRNIFYHNDGIYFAIADKKTNRLIGSIGLSSYNSYQSRIELSYDLAHQYWRRGIATKALKAVLKYAFAEFHCGNINRIEAFVSIDNIASKNFLLKCGFTLEGTLRQHRYHKGSYVDVYFFSMLRSDFAVLNIN
jgi:ribosomal-protein-alanine N-acetyltransferase